MISFLLNRKISVIMTFAALALLGIATFRHIPIGLLPDIPVPRILVQVSLDGESAQTIERRVTTPLRRILMQVDGVTDIRTTSNDDVADIVLSFPYGSNTDLALIAANEKIDAAMALLPTGISRPKAVKISASDVPVMYLQMTLSDDMPTDCESPEFASMCNVAENIVRRRIEQLPSVALVDITGVQEPAIELIPNTNKMRLMGIGTDEIWEALSDTDIRIGRLSVKEGSISFDVAFESGLLGISDIEAIPIRVNGRVFKVGDFCKARLSIKEPSGYSMNGSNVAITLAVIKQSDADIGQFRQELSEILERLKTEYSEIEFTETRDQTELLDYTISNLVQNLVIALVLVVLVVLWFIGDSRISGVVCISIIISLIITSLTFYLCGISFNIVSLCGLILALGMMVDNSLIVSENITRLRRYRLDLSECCARGASEMITPLLSSSLTTVVVFVPLVFMSGLAGAIFFDQAFAIAVGLAASYVVCITLLPIVYNMCFQGKGHTRSIPRITRITDRALMRGYDQGMDFIFRSKKFIIIIICIVLICGMVAFVLMPKNIMPPIDRSDTMANINWEEHITPGENLRRMTIVAKSIHGAEEVCASLGRQNYMLDLCENRNPDDASLYIKGSDVSRISILSARLDSVVRAQWPNATVSFHEPTTVFDKVFPFSNEMIVAEIFNTRGTEMTPSEFSMIGERLPRNPSLPVYPLVELSMNRQAMLSLDLCMKTLEKHISSGLTQYTSGSLNIGATAYTVRFSADTVNLSQYLAGAQIPVFGSRRDAAVVPVSRLVTLNEKYRYRTITGGNDGTFMRIPYSYVNDAVALADSISEAVSSMPGIAARISGSYYDAKAMILELEWILIVCIVLMYFILCAQFEDFLQPLIVLLEIPIDVAVALFALYVCDIGLNLMSAIGIIVSCGIIVNDSILKIDTINTLRRQGIPLDTAIHDGGRRRLRAIIMTSLTTVVAMLPVLFTSDIGSQLQRPMAVAMITTMAVGTLISIFIIPLLYRSLYDRKKKHI